MKLDLIGPNDPALYATQQVIQQHPEWKTTLSLIPWADYREVLMKNLAADQTHHPAVYVPGHIWIPELAEAGLITRLDPLLEQLPASLLTAYQADDIIPIIQQESLYQGQQYMIPTFNDGQILFYRSDLTDWNGKDGPVEISPLDLPDLAADLHNPPAVYGAALKAHPSEVLFDWMPYFYAAGGTLVDENLKPAFATEKGTRALECYLRMKDFAPAETLSYGNEEIADVLLEGRAALTVTWGGQAAPVFLNPDNPYREIFRTALFPDPVGATWGIALPSNQPQEIQLEALKVALAVNGPEVDLEILTAAGSPIRSSSYTDHNLENYPWLSAQQKMLERMKLFPQQAEFSIYLGPLTEAICSVLQGEQNPAGALNLAAETITQLLD